MAGKSLQKQRLAEIARRGGPEYLREWLLEGKTIKGLRQTWVCIAVRCAILY